MSEDFYALTYATNGCFLRFNLWRVLCFWVCRRLQVDSCCPLGCNGVGECDFFSATCSCPWLYAGAGSNPFAHTSRATFNVTLCEMPSTACCRYHCVATLRPLLNLLHMLFFHCGHRERLLYTLCRVCTVLLLPYRVVLVSLFFCVVHCLLCTTTPNTHCKQKRQSPNPTPSQYFFCLAYRWRRLFLC